jgi:glycerol uptake facilitator-like aquaporin
MYIYPANLKSRASLFLWQLKDVVIIIVLAMLGILALTQTGSPLVPAVAVGYAILSIRYEDNSLLDYIKYAWRYCISKPQYYIWRFPA